MLLNTPIVRTFPCHIALHDSSLMHHVFVLLTVCLEKGEQAPIIPSPLEIVTDAIPPLDRGARAAGEP